MKISTKIAIAIGILSLCVSLSAASAQTSSLNSVTSPTSTNLNSVCIVNNATGAGTDLKNLNAWAVGDGGTILMWDGSSWKTVTSPTTMNLYSVVFNSPTNGWAVGGSSTTGVILFYNGTGWSEWKTVSFSGNATGRDSINGTLYGATVSTDGMSGWAVGANGTALGWDGKTWYGFPSVTTNTLRAVGMMHGSMNAWAVGDAGTIVQWDGSKWNSMTSNTVMPLYTIQVLNSSYAMAAGGSGNSGVVLIMSGAGWTPFSSFRFGGGSGSVTSTLNATIYSMALSSATSGWACGSSGFTMYWTGSEWDCNFNATMGNLKGLDMIHGGTSIQAWSVGDGGTIIAFNGAAWVPELPVIALPVVLAIGLFVAIFAKTKLSKKPLLL